MEKLLNEDNGKTTEKTTMLFINGAVGDVSTKLRGSRNLEMEQAWIMGLTNDYLAYFTTPDEFNQGGYEACFSLYGKQSGTKILSEHKALSQSLPAMPSLKIAP